MFGPLPEGITSTLYLFGLDQDAGRPYVYAHESTSNFEPRVIDHPCTAAKPTNGLNRADLDLSGPADFITLMKRQKEIQEALPADERLYIGGQIQFTFIKSGKITTIMAGNLDE